MSHLFSRFPVKIRKWVVAFFCLLLFGQARLMAQHAGSDNSSARFNIIIINAKIDAYIGVYQSVSIVLK
jgi:hypothetical protein